MARKSVVILLVGVLASASPALAGEVGTLGKGPALDWATPLHDRDLQGIRGTGFRVFFEMFGEFSVDKNDPSGTNGLVPPADISVNDGGVTLRAALGSFNGANGIFQITQVPGNLNVVHNNLFFNIIMVSGQSAASLPSLSSLFQLPR